MRAAEFLGDADSSAAAMLDDVGVEVGAVPEDVRPGDEGELPGGL